MAIDRAKLLAGEELMERMDKEYNRTGEHDRRVHQEGGRSERTGDQVIHKEAQDSERDKKKKEMHQDPTGEADAQDGRT